MSNTIKKLKLKYGEDSQEQDEILSSSKSKLQKQNKYGKKKMFFNNPEKKS